MDTALHSVDGILRIIRNEIIYNYNDGRYYESLLENLLEIHLFNRGE